jgi:pimeloyl-ACP methyl ester carboxylesterase
MAGPNRIDKVRAHWIGRRSPGFARQMARNPNGALLMMSAFPRVLLCLALVACAPPAPQVTRSAKGPTVVFEAGLGNTAHIWDRVRLPDGLGRFAWTRAGHGLGGLWRSDADGRRTGAEVATALEQALSQAQIAPPYILVGHSLGALYVLEFARRHPGQVAGIVLVDPRLPGFTARCKANALRGCEIPDLLRLTLSPAERAELAGLPETEAALQDLSALHHIPLTILLAEHPGLGEDPRWRPLWFRHAEAFAAGFDRAKLRPVDSGHYIQTTAPKDVAAAIADLTP